MSGPDLHGESSPALQVRLAQQRQRHAEATLAEEREVMAAREEKLREALTTGARIIETLEAALREIDAKPHRAEEVCNRVFRDGRPTQKVTHGRHCSCSSCAREDWASGRFVCGMHGDGCPHVYAPLGAPGTLVGVSEGAKP